MTASEICFFPYWWLFPLAMIVLFLLLRGGRRGFMTCRFCSRGHDVRETGQASPAREILDTRYARGELNGKEYEEMKGVLRRGQEPEKA